MMANVSFQVVDGVDKGRCFWNLETPVTVGREEGNVVRLNDERVSRFHAKVQEDHGQVVLTDLDSTNGTCVNGEPIQLRLLRPGDQVTMGRSKLVFGTPEQIAAVMSQQDQAAPLAGTAAPTAPTLVSSSVADVPPLTEMARGSDAIVKSNIFDRALPPLPGRLSPAQAAQLSEVVDFLHRALADATEALHIPPNATEARLPMSHWHRIQAVLSFLARYSRQVAEPDEASEKTKMS